MKKILLLFGLTLLAQILSAQPQTNVINSNINVHIRTQRFKAHDDSDFNYDEKTITFSFLGQPAECTWWDDCWDLPCEHIDDSHSWNMYNLPLTKKIDLFMEGFEKNTSDPCTYYDGTDGFYNSGYPSLNHNGFVAGWDNKSQGVIIHENHPQNGFWVGINGYEMWYLKLWRYSNGDDIGNPLNFGTLPLGKSLQELGTNREDLVPSAVTWHDQGGQSSPDVFYAFTLDQPASVKISTSNPERTFDTQLTLYNGLNQELYFNDDANGSVDRGSLIEQVLAPGNYKIRVEGYGSEEGNYRLDIQVGAVSSTYQSSFPVAGGVTVSVNFPFKPTCSNDGVRVFDHAPSATELQAIYDNKAGFFAIPLSETASYSLNLGWGASGGRLDVFEGDLGPGFESTPPAVSIPSANYANCSLGTFCNTLQYHPYITGTNSWHNYARLTAYVKRNDAGNIEWVTVLPLFITGKKGIIRGSTLSPSVPTMVVHDPPGDKSYTQISSGKELCHGFSMEMSTDQSANLWGSVKLGVEGSVGFLVETNYEAYAQATASMEMGVNTVSGNQYQMCYKTTNTFTTSADQSADDVFIGTARKFNYGFWYEMTYDQNTCQTNSTRQVAFAPDPNEQPAIFFYPESEILNNIIPDLNQKIAEHCTDPTDPICINSKNQLHIWEQAIANNNAVKANAPLHESQLYAFFGGGSSFENSKEITTSQERFIEAEMYLETEFAIEAGVEVAGSGVSGGAGVKSRFGFGAGSNNTNSTTNTTTYHLEDDDPGDYFATHIFQDPIYGTPIFKLDPMLDSKTSCPYEGGIHLDNPLLIINGQPTNPNTTVVAPPGTTATLYLDLANESPVERQYYLKLNANSNPNNAKVTAAGALLNGNDLGQLFNVPANGMLPHQLIEIQQNTAGDILYPNLEIYLYSLCQEDYTPVRSSIFVTAQFAQPPANDLACNAITLPVNGVKQTGFTNNNATSTPAEQALAPVGNNCETSWCEGANTIAHSVWFKFVAPGSGALSISTCDLADFDTQLAVYSGSDCNNPASFTLIAANDDGPMSCSTDYDSYMEVFNLTPGATYYLLVDGYGNATGNFDIVLSPLNASATDELNDPIKFQVVPNPNSGVFQVNLQGMETSSRLTVYNLLGQVVYEQNLEPFQEKASVQIADMKAGNYIVKVNNGKFEKSRIMTSIK